MTNTLRKFTEGSLLHVKKTLKKSGQNFTCFFRHRERGRRSSAPNARGGRATAAERGRRQQQGDGVRPPRPPHPLRLLPAGAGADLPRRGHAALEGGRCLQHVSFRVPQYEKKSVHQLKRTNLILL